MPTTIARSTYLDYEARRRAITSLPAHKRLALEALFKGDPEARVGIYSLREAAARTHMVTAAEVRNASDREAQEAEEARAPRFDDPGVREAIYEQSLYGAAFSAAMADGMAKVDRGLTPREYLREDEQTLASMGVHRPEICRCYGLKGCGESHADWRARVMAEIVEPAGDAAPVLAAHLAGQSLGAVPDLSPCTLPPRPAVVITRAR